LKLYGHLSKINVGTIAQE